MFKVPINSRVFNISPYLNFIKYLVPNVFLRYKFGPCRKNFVDWTNRIRHVDATWESAWTYFMTWHAKCHYHFKNPYLN